MSHSSIQRLFHCERTCCLHLQGNLKFCLICEIQSSHSSAHDKTSLLGYEAMSTVPYVRRLEYSPCLAAIHYHMLKQYHSSCPSTRHFENQVTESVALCFWFSRGTYLLQTGYQFLNKCLSKQNLIYCKINTYCIDWIIGTGMIISHWLP